MCCKPILRVFVFLTYADHYIEFELLNLKSQRNNLDPKQLLFSFNIHANDICV